MERFQPNPITLFIFISLLTPSLAEFTNFISCLNSNDVKNFTLQPRPDNDPSSTYYTLLQISIQNVRFAQPTFPKPLAIILPNTKEQLAGAIICCRQQETLAIRIRSGGHSYEGLSSVADETPFVIIDMMNINHVAVNVGSLTAWVEAGATLGETYHAIATLSSSHGFPAGSCPTVGSGGHIGGGGFGLLSRKYGLASDNVIDAILIDGDGQFLDRKGMGEDVFWAIRGGGGGTWGVLYAWKIKLVEVSKTVTAFIVSRPGSRRQVAKLVHKWQFVAPGLEDEFYLSVFVGTDLPEVQTVGISATFKGFYLGPKTGMLSSINRVFPELEIGEEDCMEMSWIESVVYFSGLKNGSSVDQLKDRVLHDKGFFKAKSDYIRVPISVKGIYGLIDILEMEPKGYVILDPYGGMMNRITNDSLPFPHRSGNLYSIQYIVSWHEEENQRSDELINWVRGFYNRMAPYASKGPRAAYVNYLDLDLGVMNCSASRSENAVEIARSWGEKYFMGNYDRLVQAKTIIDPKNVFNNPQSIPPLPLVEIAMVFERERERGSITNESV
ncbi:berberine bridge enzyme-like D-1 [Magnolia sinica]|uniref:berberine bridge enzyme-like D-1 n=1 Tax=Magnolia sinica TaxID=86752 RepID=UPI00265AA98F|nr:berberine bridge enzyme-like D-1 [Magnolia sinica]